MAGDAEEVLGPLLELTSAQRWADLAAALTSKLSHYNVLRTKAYALLSYNDGDPIMTGLKLLSHLQWDPCTHTPNQKRPQKKSSNLGNKRRNSNDGAVIINGQARAVQNLLIDGLKQALTFQGLQTEGLSAVHVEAANELCNREGLLAPQNYAYFVTTWPGCFRDAEAKRKYIMWLTVRGHLKEILPTISAMSLEINVDHYAKIYTTLANDGLCSNIADHAKDHPGLQAEAIRCIGLVGSNTNLALKCVASWGLSQEQFPKVCFQAKLKTMRWLVASGKALEFGEDLCGSDNRLQLSLCRQLLAKKRGDDCLHFVNLFSLHNFPEFKGPLPRQSNSEPPQDPSQFLRCPIELKRVLMVSDEKSIKLAREVTIPTTPAC